MTTATCYKEGCVSFFVKSAPAHWRFGCVNYFSLPNGEDLDDWPNLKHNACTMIFGTIIASAMTKIFAMAITKLPANTHEIRFDICYRFLEMTDSCLLDAIFLTTNKFLFLFKLKHSYYP